MPSRLHEIAKFIEQLKKLADKADKLDLKLPNGAIVGNMLGAIVTDLEQNIFDQ